MRAQASIGLGTLAFIILFILKIIGQTDMNWFWVLTSWIWVPIMAMLAGLLLMLAFAVSAIILAAIFGRA